MSISFAIPSIVWGAFPEVRRGVARAVRQFASGRSWDEAMAGSTVFPEANPGLIVLNGPAPLLRGEPHFYIFLPLALVLEETRKGKMEESRKHQAVLESLLTPWGLLGVIAPANQMIVYPAELHMPILQAAVKFWDALDAVGPKYTVGLREGAKLWDVTTNLHYVLGQVGVDNEQLREELPPGGLAEIVPKWVLKEHIL